MNYPTEKEYFVINDAIHSNVNYLKHKIAGINENHFSDERCKDIWKAIISLRDRGEIELNEIILRIELKQKHNDLVERLCEFHTTRNVDYYRNLLLGK